MLQIEHDTDHDDGRRKDDDNRELGEPKPSKQEK